MTRSRVPIPSRVASLASSSRDSRENSESPGIPLQNLNPRLSTETQRRNGYRQSTLSDLGDRISEDLQNGNYECVICYDNITPGHTREHSLWHCKECYHVFHYSCINTWYKVNHGHGSSALFRDAMALPNPRWRCPHCFNDFNRPPPLPSCWCGKHSFDLGNLASSKPNACLSTCDRIGKCPHGGQEKPCQKLCHPGPCNILCTEVCNNGDVHPLQSPRTPNAWNRFCTRVAGRDMGSIRIIFMLFAMITILYCAFSVLLFYYIKWWMRLYEYYQKVRTAETIIAVVGSLVALPLSAGLCIALVTSIGKFLVAVFNLNSAERNQDVKSVTKFFGIILLAALCVGLWILPIIGFAWGPQFAWDNMMKDSCNGFSTRVNMDARKIISDTTWITKPATQFSLYTYTPGGVDEKFYLGEHLRPLALSKEPFQHYYRLSGQMNHTGPVAVDVDFQHNQWRIMHLNQTDEANEWLGKSSVKEESKITHHLPGLQPVSEKRSRNGTFDGFISDHMQIPQLDLGIQYLDKFLSRCENEPFLRVFDTSKTKNRAELVQLMERDWHDKNQEDVVMRTASFGHWHQRLDMCMKETGMSSGSLALSVMQEELLVPFTIISALRLRAWETDLHTFDCDKS